MSSETPDNAGSEGKAGLFKTWKRFGVFMVVMVAVGYAIGRGAARHELVVPPGELSLSVAAAILAGGFYVLIALIVLAAALVPKMGMGLLELDDEADFAHEKAPLFYSGLCSLCMGAALVVLALAEPAGPLAPGPALAVFAVLVAGGALCYLPLRGKLDELDWRLSDEATVISYYLLLVTGCGWAALAHLGFVPGPQFLDWLTMFWTALLIAAIVAYGRRGLID